MANYGFLPRPEGFQESRKYAEIALEIDPTLRFIVFSGSETARAAEDAGLIAVHEVFADRAYSDDGMLVPRAQPGAVIHDESVSLAQVEMMILRQKVPVVSSGEFLPVQADSVCVHGDNPSAIRFVSNLCDFFKDQKIQIAPAGSLEFIYARLGESSMLAKLPSRISRSTHRRIRALQYALNGVDGIRELIPCYAELKIDFVGIVGEFREDVLRGVLENGGEEGKVEAFENKDALVLWVRALTGRLHLGEEDLVLVKASRGLRFETIVADLVE